MKAYRIKQWEEVHENHESRKYVHLTWLSVPNKHDGLGYSYLCEQSDKVELYCAFELMLQLASKAPRPLRGWLVRGRQPLTTQMMAMMTRFPESIFIKAVEFFVRPEIDWLASDELPEAAELPLFRGRSGRRRETPGDSAGDSEVSPGATGKPPGGEERRGEERTEQEGKGIALSHSAAGAASSPRPPSPDPDAAPPALEVVTAFAVAEDIDPEWARDVWERKNAKPAENWYDRFGNLVDWRWQLKNWWPKDRVKWQGRSKRSDGENLKKGAADRRDEKRAREFQQNIEVPER